MSGGIKPEEFTKEELQNIIKTLTDLKEGQAVLKEKIEHYFKEFDKDANGFLDRRELRLFLQNFFTTYKIHFPVTDEYVDAVFREIDSNHDNKIQPEELQAYALHFVNQLLPMYQQACDSK
eukprot:CAMPEP_0170543196 /NCGR_PEP_ID=MMETSP0211-20121228/2398_1 /TAXON_ID=311385 /ORGANISM="Pseudokeronopsis sp., Strain OXSARD2" /LENGTH=120 /DNA_ID=CAMNT_0010846519 /DNA_START=14 /DNA_END=376 /DNA_ORIENTATION=+